MDGFALRIASYGGGCMIQNIFLCGLVITTFHLNSARGQNLEEIFKASLEHSASMKNVRLSKEIAKEEKSRAYATVLPNITVFSSNVWRDPADVGPFGEAYQRTAHVGLTQTLFRGGAEYYAVKIANNFPEIAEYQKIVAELQLYNQLAGIFYSAIRLKNEQKILEEQNKILQDRVKTLEYRSKIGRSKNTEVLAAKSNLARVKAELQNVSNQLALAHLQLSNFSGLSSLENIADANEVTTYVIPESWKQKLLQSPTIIQAELQLKNLKSEVGVAEGNFLPRLDLDGRYFLERAGILRDSSWEVTVNASWNLFAGGNDKSDRRIRTLRTYQQEAVLNETKINMQNDFAVLSSNFEKQKKIINELKNSVDLARQNYKAHLVEIDQGLVNHLDILRVLEDYLQTQRNYELQIFSAKVMWSQIKSLAGVAP